MTMNKKQKGVENVKKTGKGQAPEAPPRIDPARLIRTPQGIDPARLRRVGTRRIITGRYYNANYYATAIVAVITEGIDWVAYIGGADHTIPEREAVNYVADNGDKLSRADAKHFFPDIDLPYRG